ncbi:MAG: hypothetical protein E2603_16345, partial [Achromobacter sp.]|nr:hypothetical protein [Achromobacter sp.]
MAAPSTRSPVSRMSAQAYRHTTDVIAPQDQFAYWRDAICDAYVPLEPERSAAPSFRGQIDGLLLPDLHGSTITAQSHVVRLSPTGLAARAHSPFFANLLCAGEAVVSQGGSTQRAQAGDGGIGERGQLDDARLGGQGQQPFHLDRDAGLDQAVLGEDR